jgi:hypothetical protein
MITIGVILAAVITFNTPPPGRPENYVIGEVPGPVVIDGYRFTPSVWNAWIQPEDDGDRPGMYMSPWLGFDNIMTLEAANGARFNFTGFDSIGLQNGPAVVTSSNGQTLHYVTLLHRARNYEVRWENVEWIRFDQPDIRKHGNVSGFDNIRVEAVEVWEPNTVELIGCGFAGLLLFGFSRKMKWQ